MTTTAVILGILAGVLMVILLAWVGRLRASVVELSLTPQIGKPVVDPAVEAPAVEAMGGFPVEPMRFVGRAEVMAAAGTALGPASGRAAVVLQGMAGVGKTTCAVELAYRRQRGFAALAFWSAPTDPDQFGDALRLLAVALAAQLGDYGVVLLEEIVTLERLRNFLPTLTAVFADARLLLVLDDLDTLLTSDGQWRDRRWELLISALTGHQGSSRVILTSRIVPAGLNPDTVLIRPVHALSRDESLMLVGELPNLRVLLRDVALARCVLTLTQGHPTLLELADAAAADPPRLAYQLAEIEAAVDGAALAAFLTQGHTRLDTEQLRRTFTTWTSTVAATAPAPARRLLLLLQALCRIEETDRNTAVVGANWPALWRRWDRPGEPPPLASALTPLTTAALIATDPIDDPNAAAARKVDPGAAETLLRRAYGQARADGEYGLASTTAGDLVTLLRDQGRLHEALTLAGQKIEHTRQAGFGSWTQLSDQGRRLQILTLLGHHEQVLIDLPALRAQMAQLPDQRAHNDRVNPWNAREGVLDIGRLSAVALERWDDALDLNDEITTTQRRRGAGPHEIARTRFNDYLPLRHLGRLTDADHLLRDCQDAFDTAGDMRNSLWSTRPASIWKTPGTTRSTLSTSSAPRCACATSAPTPARSPQRTTPSPTTCPAPPGTPPSNALTAALLNHLTGDTRELTRTLGMLVGELRGDAGGPGSPALPTTLAEVTRLVDADDGIRLGDLVVTLCPDPATAEHALTDLLTILIRYLA